MKYTYAHENNIELTPVRHPHDRGIDVFVKKGQHRSQVVLQYGG